MLQGSLRRRKLDTPNPLTRERKRKFLQGRRGKGNGEDEKGRTVRRICWVSCSFFLTTSNMDRVRRDGLGATDSFDLPCIVLVLANSNYLSQSHSSTFQVRIHPQYMFISPMILCKCTCPLSTFHLSTFHLSTFHLSTFHHTSTSTSTSTSPCSISLDYVKSCPVLYRNFLSSFLPSQT